MIMNPTRGQAPRRTRTERLDTSRAPPRRPRRRRITLAVALILLISAALRLWQVATPAEYMFDEVYYAKDAKAIVDGRVGPKPVSYTHLRAHETGRNLVC